MSLNDITDPNTGGADWKSFYVKNLTVESALSLNGNIDVINSEPSVSIQNNGNNTLRASLDLYGNTVGNIGVSRLQQDQSGNMIIENFQASTNIELRPTAHFQLYGSNYNSTGILSLDSSHNVVVGSKASFTPVLAFGGSSTGITYAVGGQVGQYQRVGNVVMFSLSIALSNKGSSTGSASIGGLPIAAVSSTVPNQVNVSNISNITLTAGAIGVFANITSGTDIYLNQIKSAATSSALTDSDFANNSLLSFSGFYFIA